MTAADNCSLTIRAEDLPGPEEITEIEVAGYILLVESTTPRPASTPDEPDTEPAPGEVWVCSVARAPGATVTHAVRVRTGGRRRVPKTWTLCSEVGKTRRAGGERIGVPLTAVTCQHCIGRLEGVREL